MGFSYVDDRDLFNAFHTIKGIFDNMKAALHKWEHLIEVTSGCLFPNKSSWYLVNYMWKKGQWVCTNPQDARYQLEAKLQDGTMATLSRLQSLESMEMLGIHLLPSGDKTKQIRAMRDITQMWAERIRVGYLKCGEVWTALQTTISK